jgi:hypothetical protein
LPPGTCVSHWYPAKLWLVDDAEVTAANLMDFVDTDIGVLCEAELFSPRFDP